VAGTVVGDAAGAVQPTATTPITNNAMVTVILVVSRFFICLSSCEQKWLWRTIDDA
jgi:hypothetical protein